MDKQVIMRQGYGSLFFVLLLLFCCVSLLCGCNEQEGEAKGKRGQGHYVAAAALGFDDSGNMRVSGSDNCGICGMPVHKHIQFATGIELHDHTSFYFCGTQCLLRAWLQPDIFLGAEKVLLKRSVVTSYFSGKPIDGKEAYFVMGSDVMGPMGPGLIALADERERDAFVQRHGGSSVYGIEGVSKGLLEEASGRTFGGK